MDIYQPQDHLSAGSAQRVKCPVKRHIAKTVPRDGLDGVQIDHLPKCLSRTGSAFEQPCALRWHFQNFVIYRIWKKYDMWIKPLWLLPGVMMFFLQTQLLVGVFWDCTSSMYGLERIHAWTRRNRLSVLSYFFLKHKFLIPLLLLWNFNSPGNWSCGDFFFF